MVQRKSSLILALPLLFATHLVPTASGYENELSLKFGPSATTTIIRSISRTTTPRMGMGFHSHMAYKWTRWEASMSSYAHIGPVNRVRFLLSGSDLEGSFNFRSISFGPLVRYHTPYRPVSTNWPLYVLAGFLAAQQSFKARTVNITGGSYQPFEKITLESYGPVFGIGLEEEITPKKYNFFYEFIFRSLVGRRLDRVGGTHKKVEIMSTEKSPDKIREHTFQFNIGIIIF